MQAHLTDQERFWAKVNKAGSVPDYAPHLGNCWLWTGRVDAKGYGMGYFERRVARAHHFLVGRPNPGMHWDHLCRVRSCVRPEHLEMVTPQENWRRGFSPPALNERKTHCPRGHAYDLVVTRGRWCRTCKIEALRRARRDGPRQTHCMRGHPLTPENVIVCAYRDTTKRLCLACIALKKSLRKETETPAQQVGQG
jgi:hypothetical protein